MIFKDIIFQFSLVKNVNEYDADDLYTVQYIPPIPLYRIAQNDQDFGLGYQVLNEMGRQELRFSKMLVAWQLLPGQCIEQVVDAGINCEIRYSNCQTCTHTLLAKP